jgi:hypothetical protein
MATILTGITNPYQSKGSVHSNSKAMDILPRAKSEEDWPRRNPFHPSSPPVRERSRYTIQYFTCLYVCYQMLFIERYSN